MIEVDERSIICRDIYSFIYQICSVKHDSIPLIKAQKEPHLCPCRMS